MSEGGEGRIECREVDPTDFVRLLDAVEETSSVREGDVPPGWMLMATAALVQIGLGMSRDAFARAAGSAYDAMRATTDVIREGKGEGRRDDTR